MDTQVSGPVEVDNSAYQDAVWLGARTPDGRVFVMIELEEKPTGVVYAQTKALSRGNPAEAAREAGLAAMSHLKVVQAQQEVFASRLYGKSLPRTAEIYRLQRVFNGFAVRTTDENLAALARLPGVKAIHPLPLQELNHHHSVPLIGAPEFWDTLGFHGEGVKVGIIDTGIDYLHADFGGPGLLADYDSQDFSVVEAGSFPTGKVVGGWDFAGKDYDAGEDETDIPTPDGDPLDGHGHGTHVAGSTAGLGVLVDGVTYTGSYDMSLDREAFSIAPGVAPRAELYALKVFGDGSGSTMLSGKAVEWAVDPDGDGDPADRLDVVNLSLGSSYGSGGTEATIFNNAVAQGLIIVASAGNSGDNYFITGAPSQSEAVISVAAAKHDGMEFTAIKVEPGSSVTDGLYDVGLAFFGPQEWDPVNGELMLPTVVEDDPENSEESDDDDDDSDDPEGCSPFQFTDFSGKIALIDRGSCAFVDKVINAQTAGAIAVVVANHTEGAGFINMGGSNDEITIPSMMITFELGADIKAAMGDGETISVTMDLANTLVHPEFQDSIASFSSRGPVHDGPKVRLKPDITGPGVDIHSARTLSGTEGVAMGGTSMSSPHVAGVMTLLRQLHPDWSAPQLKALVMNTASNDVFFDQLDGQSICPGRVGAGRVDVANAMNSDVIAYASGAPFAVSVAFETLDVVGSVSESKAITLHNLGDTALTYDLTFDLRSDVIGADFTAATPGPFTVEPGATSDVTITLTADASSMERALDPGLDRFPGGNGRYTLSEEAGYAVFRPQDGGQVLRVPLYAVLRPASDMAASSDSITPDDEGLAEIGLTGTGVATTDVNSLVTPLELKYVSPQGDLELGWDLPGYWQVPEDWDIMHAASADLKYVGVTSDLKAQLEADPENAWANSQLYFGLVVHGLWGSPRELGFIVSIDLNDDQEVDYFVNVNDFNLDFFRSTLFDAEWNEISWQAFNGFFPTEYGKPFVPAFMSDAVVLPVSAADLGLAEGASRIAFKVETQWWPYWDQTPWMHYDLAAPAVSFNTAEVGQPTTADVEGGLISARVDAQAAELDKTGGVLLIHHHNAAGLRGESIKIEDITCESDDDCTDPWNRYCDTGTGVCVGCLETSQCFEGAYCGEIRECVTDCSFEGANACSPGSFCDASGQCIHDCTWSGASPCAEGTYCDSITGWCMNMKPLVVMTDLPVGDENCPFGGVLIESGLDANNNGELDADEVDYSEYVCNGEDPPEVLFSEQDADPADCPNGGTQVSSGADDNRDGILDPDEIDNSFTVCNGDSGSTALVETGPADPADCPNGGQLVSVGLDENANGTLDDGEVLDSWNICDGSSLTALIDVGDEAAGDNCEHGGQKVETGLDDNGNGNLDTDEVDNTSYICNGAPATGGDGDGCSTTGSGRASVLALLLFGFAALTRRLR